MVVVEPRVTKKMLKQLKDRIHLISRASENQRVLNHISNPLQSALEIVEKKVKPRVVYDIFSLLSSNEASVMTRAGSVESPMFSSMVNQSENNGHIVFMIGTIGSELEKGVDSSDDILSQWIYDIIGSELVEIIADDVENGLKKILAAHELELSHRFSPGYCDWSIEGQQIIFSALEAEKIDVKLTPQKMMIPKKSISCVMVSAKKVPVKSPCLLCSKKECPFRRRRDE